MTLHNFIRRRSLDDVAFIEFDRNSNFVPMIFYLMLLHDQEAMETVVFIK
jgi:hypothetical protein